MNAPPPAASLSPIRIYVLWHPDMDKSNRPELKGRGLKLARRIYHWFRMESMDGIPVYFRSQTGDDHDILPIRQECGVRNYILPLVDSHMVSSPEWRSYVSQLAELDDDVSGSRRACQLPAGGETRVFPVAVESVAYNMPDSLRRLNFIRHVARDEVQPDDLELLSRLTEAVCRDLRFWLRRKDASRAGPNEMTSIPAKIKIFLSHAKADNTTEAIAIKEYIQRETQCEAFFDETDIAAGYDFADVIGSSLSQESAGLIVIQGDNYADRPWCRKEIRDFLTPVPVSSAPETGSQYFIPPVVVVQAMKGRQIGRTIAELGYSPCMQWDGAAPVASARFVVTTLLREILFGLFYRVLAEATLSSFKKPPLKQVYINRAPDPVMVNRIIKYRGTRSPVTRILHPGYGLSRMEKDGLDASVPGIQFAPFQDATPSTHGLEGDLGESIIAITAGNSDDIISMGMGDEHVRELLVRVVRPLVSAGASLLYGGVMPETLRLEKPWSARVDFTAALIQLLVTERETAREGRPARKPRLFVPVPWHDRNSVTAHTIAHWTDLCTFARVPLADTGINADALPHPPAPPDDADLADDTPQERRAKRKKYADALAEWEAVELAQKALSLSAMRRKICDEDAPLLCRLPDSGKNQADGWFRIRTRAHILIGGKSRGFSGTMPGVFEEALYAFKVRKPVFLVAEGGGAAALLARWLVRFGERPESPPKDFTMAPYRAHPGGPSYAHMLTGLNHAAFAESTSDTPKGALGELWELVLKAKDPQSLATLLNNGLSADENLRLLHSVRDNLSDEEQEMGPPSTHEICRLVWTGISKTDVPRKK